MISPAELALLAKAEGYIVVPYRLHGASVEAWDCLGLVKVLAPILFGWEAPYGVGFYSRRDAVIPERRAALLEQGARAWKPCIARPGVVALFKDLGRPNHVALMLTAKTFIHARDETTGTVIEDMTRTWSDKLVGYFECA
jgi:cell wall-associated NlpC family hydrolase